MLKSVGAEGPGGEKLILVCLHWRNFPPASAVRMKGIEEQRMGREVTSTEYQHHLVWARICGLVQMDRKKCRRCEHVRYLKMKGMLWVLETKDGVASSPIIDLPTLESMSRQKVMPPTPPQIPGRRSFSEKKDG